MDIIHHEADMGFQSRVRQRYLEACENDPSFLRIDCSDPGGHMLPAVDIFRKIRDQIDAVL